MPKFSDAPLKDGSFQFVDDESDECESTLQMKTSFVRDGFIIVRGLFNRLEVDKVKMAAQNAPDYWDAAFSVKDDDGRRFWQTHWKEPGEDVFGRCGKTKKVLTVCEQLLGKGELYMYSGKIIMKPSRDGGRLEWHQDYGYWYKNECVTADMVSCFIALTKNDKENGGLQVIRGSHHCGRISHDFLGGQQGADPSRVELILKDKRFEHVYCNLVAGDAIFFHCNLLHTSHANLSEFKRWNMIYSYNTVENSPTEVHYNAIYTEPLVPMSCDAIKQCEDLTVQKRSYTMPNSTPHLRDARKLTNGSAKDERHNVHMVINEETIFDKGNGTDGIPPDRRTKRKRTAVLPDWTEPIVEFAAGALKTKRHSDDGYGARRSRRTIDISFDKDNATERTPSAKTSQEALDRFVRDVIANAVHHEDDLEAHHMRRKREAQPQASDNRNSSRKTRQQDEPMFTIDNPESNSAPGMYIIDSGKEKLPDTIRIRTKPGPGQPWHQEGSFRTPVHGTVVGQHPAFHQRVRTPMSVRQFYGPNTRPDQRAQGQPPPLAVYPHPAPPAHYRPQQTHAQPPPVAVYPHPAPPTSYRPQQTHTILRAGPLQPNRDHVFDFARRPQVWQPNRDQNSQYPNQYPQNTNQFSQDQYRYPDNQRQYHQKPNQFAQNQYPQYRNQYHPNQNQHPQSQNQYSPNQNQYPQNQNQHPQNRNHYPQNQNQYPQSQYQYSPNQNQYPQNQNQYRPNQNQYPQRPQPQSQYQYSPNQNQYPQNQNQYPQSQYQYSPNQNQYPQNQNQYPQSQYQYSPNQNQYPQNQNQYPQSQYQYSPNQNQYAQSQYPYQHPSSQYQNQQNQHHNQQDRSGNRQNQYNSNHNQESGRRSTQRYFGSRRRHNQQQNGQPSPVFPPGYYPPPVISQPQPNYNNEYVREQLYGLLKDVKVLFAQENSQKAVKIGMPKKDDVERDGQLEVKVGDQTDPQNDQTAATATKRYIPLG